ncbi:Ankyrin repeat domain-containing protein M-T5 [Lumpy skin disease virus]|nr:Ankyrin repeat domain-containing protein M-T5 [Lumpy skin disease virus]WNY14687.1 Ankyrin repeat domain-containing protein M-T5 [Lumpy skin disease virus]
MKIHVIILIIFSPKKMSLLYEYVLHSPTVDKDAVELLIRTGFDVNEENCDNESILLLYLKRKDVSIDILRLLLENGADVNYRSYYDTSITSVIRNYELDSNTIKQIIILLLKFGADINLKPFNGVYTIMPFIYNFHINNCNMFKFLLSKGIYVKNDIIDSRGFNLFHMYFESFSVKIDVIKILLSFNVGLFEKSFKGLTPMNIYFDHFIDVISLKVIKYLISKGVNIETNNNGSKSLLETFLRSNKILSRKCFKVLNFILKYVKLNKVDEKGLNPILISAKADNYDAFNHLLKLGDDIYNVSKKGNTVITYAIKRENIDILNRVLAIEPKKYLIKQTFEYFSNYGYGGINGLFLSERKSLMMILLMQYSFKVYPIFYKNFYEVRLLFPNIIEMYNEDILLMEKEKVGKNISVYDLVFNREKETIPVKFLKNENFLKFTSSTIYGERIKQIINNTYRYENCLNTSINILNKYCNKKNYWNYLPTEIKIHILEYLDFSDFDTIINPKRKSKKYFL